MRRAGPTGQPDTSVPLAFLFDPDQPSHVARPVSENANSDSATFVRTRALKIGNAGQVAPIGKLSVVMVAIIAAVFLREKMSPI